MDVLVRRPVAFLLAVTLAAAGCMGGGKASSGGLRADFDFDPGLPVVDEPVEFVDTSTGPVVSWAWDFGDLATSAEQNPVHTFTAPGLYEVALTVEDGRGHRDHTSRFLDIQELGGSTPVPNGFQVDFRYEVDGLGVEFEPIVPAGTSVDQYYWDFGDGDVSRDSAPRHDYASVGLYTVVLRVSANAKLAQATHVVPVGVDVADPTGLASRSFAVVAIVDSGINPYHEEFRDAAFQENPANYVTAYPDDAMPIELSLDADTYSDALDADDEAWDEVKPKRLYWIPGTRIIGAWSQEKTGPHVLLDDDGHGTATASDAAGASVGSCATCLIVAVEGGATAQGILDGFAWAASQPWIDVISNSWSICLLTCQPDAGLWPPIVGSAATSKGAVEAGRAVFQASGNGMLNMFDVPTLTYWNAMTGPDWVMTIGAADAPTGATVLGTGRPVDAVSLGYDWKGASHTSMNSIEDFHGTSAATPVAAGAYAWILQNARQALNDTDEGAHGGRGIVGVGNAGGGMLSDGKLTRAEVERALLLSARPATGSGPIVPTTLPNSPASFLYAGYGLIDSKSAKVGLKIVTGDSPLPTRTVEDQWAAADSQVRRAIWGSWSGEEDGRAGPASADPAKVEAWLEALGYAEPPAGLIL